MFKLPPLPYSFDALEPYIDAKTMELHYTKHHQTYLDNLNTALEKHSELQKSSIENLLTNISQIPQDIQTAVRNNGGGYYNHALFWEWMKKGGGAPRGKSAVEIEKAFGDYETFKQKFSSEAKSKFGSGWAWLCLNKKGNLVITVSSDQDSPISEGLTPILGLDVWEHAYYLKYQNRRVDYIQAWWNVVNWDRVEELFIQNCG